MRKLIILDMDGTIADLYGVDNWLQYLREENPFPYTIAVPMVDMKTLTNLLMRCKLIGWEIAVTSWLSMNSSRSYKEEVRQAKKDWLVKVGLDMLIDEIHLVQYGTPKQRCTKADIQILFDDSADVRKKFTNVNKNRYAVNPVGENLINTLQKIIEKK